MPCRTALILPTSAIIRGSYDAQNNLAYNWQRLRNLLYEHYDQIVIVSIAQPEKKDSAFSADSDFAGCMVIARRIPTGGTPSRRAHFVNLIACPSSKLEAQETARAIKVAIANTTETDDWNRVAIGGDEIGFVLHENTAQNRKWTTLRISEPTLAQRARKFQHGELSLPQRARSIQLPVTAARSLAQVKPVHCDVIGRSNSPFSKRDGYNSTHKYPMLSNHDKKGQTLQSSMLVQPDSYCEVRHKRDNAAEHMWN